MKAFTNTAPSQRRVCQHSPGCRAFPAPRVQCQPHAPLQQQQHHHHHHHQQQQQHWSLRAAPDEDRAADTPPAAAPPSMNHPNDSATQQADVAATPLNNLAESLGSQKAFVSEEEWRVMDKKVNKYPSQRTFTAIGTGGDDFKDNMMKAVETVVGTVHVECVSERPSSGGKYVSVRIGPVWVETADQVVQVFSNMRQDKRLKWYM